MKKLILASCSPRRKELLTEYGFEYEIIKSDFEEGVSHSPEATAIKNAVGKATFVYFKLKDSNCVVLGADTIVVFNGEILGKPKDIKDAVNMLKKLSGNTHTVITACAITSNEGTALKSFSSEVTFNELSDELIKDYVSTGSPLDKAGAYGVQDGFNIVKKVNGSLNNVIGLPIELFKDELKGILQ